jgi:uracil-DNA glycosylase
MKSTEFQSHIENINNCVRCPDVVGPPVSGSVEGSKILHIGQAPGPHEARIGRPFAYTAGKKLFHWFSLIGIDEEDYRNKVCMSAMLRCFPGKGIKGAKGDRTPSITELANCRPFLDFEFSYNQPELVIPIGRFAIGAFKKKFTMNDTIGLTEQGSFTDPVTSLELQFDWIALPHPSGLNVWVERPEGKKLLYNALNLIAEHPVIKKTFPGVHAL